MPLTSLLHGAPQLHYWQQKQQVVEALHSLMMLRFNKANFMDIKGDIIFGFPCLTQATQVLSLRSFIELMTLYCHYGRLLLQAKSMFYDHSDINDKKWTPSVGYYTWQSPITDK